MNNQATDRGVSDTLGFILIFSVIVTSIGITYAFGVPAVGDLQEHQQSESAITAFRALAVGLDDIQHDRAPSRAMDLDLGGRTLGISDETTLEIRINDSTVATIDGALVYGGGRATEIAYHGGGVLRQDNGVGAFRSDPRLYCANGRVLVSVVELRSSQQAVYTQRSVRVRAVRQGVQTQEVTGGEVQIKATGKYAEAWQAEFRQRSDETAWTYDESTGTMECTASEGLVRETRIDIQLIR